MFYRTFQQHYTGNQSSSQPSHPTPCYNFNQKACKNHQGRTQKSLTPLQPNSQTFTVTQKKKVRLSEDPSQILPSDGHFTAARLKKRTDKNSFISTKISILNKAKHAVAASEDSSAHLLSFIYGTVVFSFIFRVSCVFMLLMRLTPQTTSIDKKDTSLKMTFCLRNNTVFALTKIQNITTESVSRMD